MTSETAMTRPISDTRHSVPASYRADQLYTSIQILEYLDLDIHLDLDMNIYVFCVNGVIDISNIHVIILYPSVM